MIKLNLNVLIKSQIVKINRRVVMKELRHESAVLDCFQRARCVQTLASRLVED